MSAAHDSAALSYLRSRVSAEIIAEAEEYACGKDAHDPEPFVLHDFPVLKICKKCGKTYV